MNNNSPTEEPLNMHQREAMMQLNGEIMKFVQQTFLEQMPPEIRRMPGNRRKKREIAHWIKREGLSYVVRDVKKEEEEADGRVGVAVYVVKVDGDPENVTEVDLDEVTIVEKMILEIEEDEEDHHEST